MIKAHIGIKSITLDFELIHKHVENNEMTKINKKKRTNSRTYAHEHES